MTRVLLSLILSTCILMMSGTTYGLDMTHRERALVCIDKGIAYLRKTQSDNGCWSPEPGPGITAMAIMVMLDRGTVPEDDPVIENAIKYIISKAQLDGGIHDGILANYNTAICLSSLSRLRHRTELAEVIRKAQDFLTTLQWKDKDGPGGRLVDTDHPYYGGAGYGKHGRPDMSNTQFMLQALYNSGLDREDPAYQAAVVFITRCQGTEQNKMYGHLIRPDGGFIYATSVDKDNIDTPQSKAGWESIDEDYEGVAVSRLRTYGSMTYAGFKSYLYANLSRSDPRVIDAYNWIKRHYTLEQNPGMPEDQKMEGLYYYYMTFARALRAWDDATITTDDGELHDWAEDLIDRLAPLQRVDGSWINEEDRWMESDPNLVTCYALIALTEAIREE